MGDLNDRERIAISQGAALLSSLDVTRMVKSFKMLVILTALNLDKLPDPGVTIDELVAEFRRLVKRSGKLRADVGAALDPGGHLEFPHLWPGQNPPVDGDGTGCIYAL